MRLQSRLRRLAVPALLMLFFWLAAQVASGIPPLHVISTSVDGLQLADYRQDPLRMLGIAPLSDQIYSDAYRDALSGRSGVSWVWYGDATPNGQVAAAAPSGGTSTGRPAFSPSPSTAVSSPIPTAWPSSSAPPSASSTPTATATPTVTASVTATPSPTASATASPTATPTPTSSGTFTGRVIDWSTNGGIPGATLTLSPGGPITTTDSSGSFTESVPAGTYTLAVSASGYPSQSQSINMRAGSKTSATIWLVPSAQAGSVQGRVTDSATGLPIAGVSLYINQPGITVYTDANGNYSFTDLSTGNKRVAASAANYASLNSGCTVTAGSITILNIKLVHI